QARAGKTGRANRYAPEMAEERPQFTLKTRKAVGPDDQELYANPRARSAKLRVAVRTEAPAGDIDARSIGMPQFGGRSR
ncbi:MAG: 16S rRNA (cytosine(1402)-N(4))-methyltransferase, partial [Pseudomonadota bacterium]